MNSKHQTNLHAGYLVLLVVLVSVPFYRLFSGWGQSILGYVFCDGPHMFYWIRKYAAEEFAAGRIPLWNPYLFCGMPFHAEGQAGLFYPLNILFQFLSTGNAINLFVYVHWVANGLCFYYLLVQYRLRPLACLFGAVSFCCSAGVVSRVFGGHLTTLAPIPYIALFLALWERYFRERKGVYLVLMALVYGVLILIGHPQSLFYYSIFFLLYVIWSVTVRGNASLRERCKMCLGFVGVVAGGVLVGAVQLVPSIQYLSLAHREKMAFEFCGSFSFPWQHFITFLFPGFFGDIVHTSYWGHYYLWEMWGYVGLFTLVFALGSLAYLRSKKMIAFFACGAVIFSVLALGVHTPVFWFLYHYIPFFDLFRGNAKFILVVQFCLAVLGAYGFDAFFCDHREGDRAGRIHRGLVFVLFLLIACGCLIGMLVMRRYSDRGFFLLFWDFLRQHVSRASINMLREDINDVAVVWKLWRQVYYCLYRTGLLALAGLVITSVAALLRINKRLLAWFCAGILFVDVVLFAAQYFVVYQDKDLHVAEELVSFLKRDDTPYRVYSRLFSPNQFMGQRIPHVSGYVGAPLKRTNRFLTTILGIEKERSLAVGRFDVVPDSFGFLGMKYLIVLPGMVLPDEEYLPVYRREKYVVWQKNNVVPFVYFPQNVRIENVPDAVLAEVSDPRFSPLRQSVVEALSDGMAPDVNTGAVVKRVSNVVENSPGRVVVSCEKGSDGLLVLQEAYAPGWEAYLSEGARTAVYPANYLFMGVDVPGDVTQVTLKYRPPSFLVGSFLSLLALLFGTGFFLFFVKKNLVKFEK